MQHHNSYYFLSLLFHILKLLFLSGPNFLISPNFIFIAEVLAVILSKPINSAVNLLSFKVFFYLEQFPSFGISFDKSSVSSKLGLISFKLIKGVLIILSLPKDKNLKKRKKKYYIN